MSQKNIFLKKLKIVLTFFVGGVKIQKVRYGNEVKKHIKILKNNTKKYFKKKFKKVFKKC